MNKNIIKGKLNKRTIVISDIHGHLTLFKQLLTKIHYTNEDTLVILGDFIEKGPEILDTIHYLMELSKHPNVYILNGNCEWAIYEWVDHVPYLKQYLRRARYSIFHEVFDLHHIDYSSLEENQLREILQILLKKELAFINRLPVLVETEDYIFVHAGIEDRLDFDNSSMSSLLEQQFFMHQHHSLNKYVIVGHLPTSNYHLNHIDNRIIIDEEKKIISIDGGMGVKEVCQLNAFIIEENHFIREFILPFMSVKIKKAYYPGLWHHHKIAWPHFEVKLLEKGEEFSKCQKVYNDEILMIKNEYLYHQDNKTYCLDDYTDFHISVDKGDIVYLIKVCHEYAYIIKGDEVGWIKKDCLDVFLV